AARSAHAPRRLCRVRPEAAGRRRTARDAAPARQAARTGDAGGSGGVPAAAAAAFGAGADPGPGPARPRFAYDAAAPDDPVRAAAAGGGRRPLLTSARRGQRRRQLRSATLPCSLALRRTNRTTPTKSSAAITLRMVPVTCRAGTGTPSASRPPT